MFPCSNKCGLRLQQSIILLNCTKGWFGSLRVFILWIPCLDFKLGNLRNSRGVVCGFAPGCCWLSLPKGLKLKSLLIQGEALVKCNMAYSVTKLKLFSAQPGMSCGMAWDIGCASRFSFREYAREIRINLIDLLITKENNGFFLFHWTNLPRRRTRIKLFLLARRPPPWWKVYLYIYIYI